MVITQSDEGKLKMALVVKGEITITIGFDNWKAMAKKNHKRMGMSKNGFFLSAFCRASQ